MRRQWRFLGSSATKSVSKVLLEVLDRTGDGLDCYRDYVKNTVSFTVAHKLVCGLTPELLARFYNVDDAQSDPRYFSIFEEICISKLETVLQMRLVLLLASSEDSFHKLHDKRIFDRLQRTRATTETLYFVLERRNRVWNLYQLRTEADIKSYVPILTELAFITADSMHVARDGQCFLEVIARVLGNKLCSRHVVHGEHCFSLRELVFLDDSGKSMLCEMVGTSAGFILASHTRVGSRLARVQDRTSPKNNLFGIHAIYQPSGGGDGSEGDGVHRLDHLPVVCLTHDFRFYLLKEPYATSVRHVEQRLRHLRREPFPDYAAKAFAELQRRTRDKLLQQSEASACQRQRDGDSYSMTCPCLGCENKVKYTDKNMSFAGPQFLYRQDLSCFDLMRLFGRFGKKCEEDLLRCCTLSVASYDLETMGVPVQDAVGNEDLNINVSTLSDIRIPRQIHSRHEIVRIGFTDQVRSDRGEPTLIFRYEEGKKTEGLVNDFMETLFEHRDAAVTVKLGILHEYLAWVDAYKRRHFEFWVREEWLPADYCALRLPRYNDELAAEAVAAAAEAAAAAQEGEDDDQDAALDAIGREVAEDLARRMEEGDWETAAAAAAAVDNDSDDDGGEPMDLSDYESGSCSLPSRQEQRQTATSSSSSNSSSSSSSGTSSEERDDHEPATAAAAGDGDTLSREAAERVRRQQEERRIRDIEDAWTWSIWGILEKRLRSLAHAYNCYAFNR